MRNDGYLHFSDVEVELSKLQLESLKFAGLYCRGSQNVVPGPAATASFENLLKCKLISITRDFTK